MTDEDRRFEINSKKDVESEYTLLVRESIRYDQDKHDRDSFKIVLRFALDLRRIKLLERVFHVQTEAHKKPDVYACVPESIESLEFKHLFVNARHYFGLDNRLSQHISNYLFRCNDSLKSDDDNPTIDWQLYRDFLIKKYANANLFLYRCSLFGLKFSEEDVKTIWL